MSFNKTQVLANLRAALSQMYSLEANEGLSLKEFGSFLDSLESLWEESVNLYRKDENGKYKALEEKNYTALISVYQNALDKAADALLSDADPRLKDLTTQIKTMLSTDLLAIKNVVPGKDITLPELIEKGRSVSIDLGEAKLIGSGNALSNRVPVEYTLPDGTVKKGFFTPKSHVPGRKELDDALKPVEEKYPEFKFFFDKMRTLDDNTVFNGIEWGDLSAAVMALDYAVSNGQSAGQPLIDSTFEPLKFSPDEKGILLNNPKFLQFANDVMNAAGPVTMANYTYTDSRRWIGIKAGERIDSRNAAVSMVAKLLGENDLVAKAEPMTIISNGQKIEGTFMENAYGKEVFNLAPDDPIRKYTSANYESPETISQIANTQVIDYICGNVDRHEGNFFMQFDGDGTDAKLTKITLIDNDLSFGTNNNAKGNIFINPSEMSLIDADMAAKVMALTETTLKMTLKGYGISDESLNAAWERTQILQKQITASLEKYKDIPEGKISKNVPRVVAKKDMGLYTLETLSKGGARNQFEKFNDLAYYIREHKSSQVMKANNNKVLQEKYGIAPEAEKPKAQRLTGTIVRDDSFIQPVKDFEAAKPLELIDIEIPQQSELETHAGNLSSRKAVSYEDEDGKLYEGFFTANHELNLDRETNRIFSRYVSEYPQFQDFINTYKYIYDYQGSVGDVLRWGMPGYSIEDIEVLKQQDGFEKMLKSMGNALGVEKDFQGAYISGCGAVANSSIDYRNVAMSQMATLLGVPNIIANARPMRIKQGNQFVEGIFMDKAVGVDSSRLLPGDPMTTYTEEVYNHGAGLKALAELEVLDYICCNADRHINNMTYQFAMIDGQPKFVGVQGFDNDMSFFAKRYGDDKTNQHLAALNDIKVISEQQAKMIENLDPMQIEDALSSCRLGGKERGAAIDRLNLIKQRIKENKIEIVKDEQWKDKNLASLESGGNIFHRVKKYVNGQEIQKTAERNALDKVKQETSFVKGEKTEFTEQIIADTKRAREEELASQSIAAKKTPLTEAEQMVKSRMDQLEELKNEHEANKNAINPLSKKGFKQRQESVNAIKTLYNQTKKQFGKLKEYKDLVESIDELNTLLEAESNSRNIVDSVQHREDVKEQVQYMQILTAKLSSKLEGNTKKGADQCREFATQTQEYLKNFENTLNKYSTAELETQAVLIEGQRHKHAEALDKILQDLFAKRYSSKKDNEYIQARYVSGLAALSSAINSGAPMKDADSDNLAAAMLAGTYLLVGKEKYGEEALSIFEGQHKQIYETFLKKEYVQQLSDAIKQCPEDFADIIVNHDTKKIYQDFIEKTAMGKQQAKEKPEEKAKEEPQALI